MRSRTRPGSSRRASPRRTATPRRSGSTTCPVVCTGLHSQLAPVCAALAGRRVAYVQLAGGALPVSLSDTVRALKARMLLDTAIAVSPCLDGDLQCVTTASALTHAAARGADVVVCGIGPGIVGTGSRWGHGGLAVADAANVAPRSGRADRRAARLVRRRAPAAPRAVAPHALGARALPRRRAAWPGRAGSSASGRRRGRGRRDGLGGVRAAPALAHGPRAGRRPVVLRGGVRGRAPRRRRFPTATGAVSSRAPCGSGSPRRSSRRSTASRSPRPGRSSSSSAATRSSSSTARGRLRLRRRGVRGRRRAARRRRGGLVDGRAAAQGEGADRARVPAAARGPHALHVPPHRGGRAADAGAARLGHHRRRLRDGRDRRPPAAAARSDERGRGPARAADGRVGAREGARRRGILLGGVPGVPPAKVVVLGGGVVGLNAAIIALGMQADVWVLDKSVDRMRELEIALDGRVTLAMSNRLQIEEVLPDADMVIGAVLVPGALAPKLVTREMLGLMKPGRCSSTSRSTRAAASRRPTRRPTTTRSSRSTASSTTASRTCRAPCPSRRRRALTNVTLPYVEAIADKGSRARSRTTPRSRRASTRSAAS